MRYTFLDLLGMNPLRPMIAFGGDDSSSDSSSSDDGGGGGSTPMPTDTSVDFSLPGSDDTLATIDYGSADEGITGVSYTNVHTGETFDNAGDLHASYGFDDDDGPSTPVVTTPVTTGPSGYPSLDATAGVTTTPDVDVPTYTDTSTLTGIADASGDDYVYNPDTGTVDYDPIVSTGTGTSGMDAEPVYDPVDTSYVDTSSISGISDASGVDYGGGELGMTDAPTGVVDFTTIDLDTGVQEPVVSIDYGTGSDDGYVAPVIVEPEPPAPPPVYYDMFGNEYGSQAEATAADDLYNTVIATPATEAVTPTLEAGYDVDLGADLDPASMYETSILREANVPIPESYMPTSEDFMPGITGTDTPRAEENDIRALYGMEPIDTETDAIQTELDDLLGGGDDLVETTPTEADELALELGLPTVDLEDYTPTSAELYGGDVPKPLSVEDQVAQYEESLLDDYESASGEGAYGGMDALDFLNEYKADLQAEDAMENLINTGALDDTIVAGTEVTPSQAIQDPNIFNYEGDNFVYAGNEDITYGINATANAQPFENIVFHHTGNNYPAENQVNYSQMFDEERGGRFGYHFVVGKDGTVYQSAPMDARTNHLLSRDLKDDFKNVTSSNSLGISLVGAGDEDFTPEQIAAAQNLAIQLQSDLGIENVYGQGAIQSGKMASEGVTLANMVNEASAPVETDFDVIPTADGAVTSEEIDNLVNEVTGGTIRTDARDADLAIGSPEEVIDVPIPVSSDALTGPDDVPITYTGDQETGSTTFEGTSDLTGIPDDAFEFSETPTLGVDTSNLDSILERSGIDPDVLDPRNFTPEDVATPVTLPDIDTDTAVQSVLEFPEDTDLKPGVTAEDIVDAPVMPGPEADGRTASQAYLDAMKKLDDPNSLTEAEQRALYGARGQVPNAAETAYLQDLLGDARHKEDGPIGADGEPIYRAGDYVTEQSLGDKFEDLFALGIDTLVNPLSFLGEDFTVTGQRDKFVQEQLDAYKNGGTFVYGEDGKTVVGVAKPNYDADGDGVNDTVVLNNANNDFSSGDDDIIVGGSISVSDVNINNDIDSEDEDAENYDIDVIFSDTTYENTEDGVVEERAGQTEEEEGEDGPINPCPEGYVLDPETNECVPIADVGDEGPSKPRFKDVEREIIRRPEGPTPTPEEVEGLIIRTPSFAQGGPVTRNIDSFVRSMRG